MADGFSKLGTSPLYKLSERASLVKRSKRFETAPDDRANWSVRKVVEELLANKVSVFHGRFEIDGIAVGLMMFAGADAARLMRVAGTAIAAELAAETKAVPKTTTGPTPKDM